MELMKAEIGTHGEAEFLKVLAQGDGQLLVFAIPVSNDAGHLVDPGENWREKASQLADGLADMMKQPAPVDPVHQVQPDDAVIDPPAPPDPNAPASDPSGPSTGA